MTVERRYAQNPDALASRGDSCHDHQSHLVRNLEALSHPDACLEFLWLLYLVEDPRNPNDRLATKLNVSHPTQSLV